MAYITVFYKILIQPLEKAKILCKQMNGLNGKRMDPEMFRVVTGASKENPKSTKYI